MSSTVLDASALLALLQQEAGSDVVAQAVQHGTVICAVNLAEVVGKLADAEVPTEVIEQILLPIDIEVVPFDTRLAYRAGLLRPLTRAQGLSLGDRACIALAQERQLPILVAERGWQGLSLGVELRMIR